MSNSQERAGAEPEGSSTAADPVDDGVAGRPSDAPSDAAAYAQPTDLKTQVFRFGMSGGLAAVVDYGLLQLLMLAGLSYTPAKAISFVFGTLTAYMINRRWTFGAQPSTKRFIATMIVYAIMFGVQVGLFHLLTGQLLDSGLGLGVATTIAFVIAQGVATVVNFIVQRTIIFRVRA